MEKGSGAMSRINPRRLTVTGTLVVGAVVGVASLAWACTTLVHAASFAVTPPSSVCEDLGDGVKDATADDENYACTPVTVQWAGHLGCEPDNPLPGGTEICTAPGTVFQDMNPAIIPQALNNLCTVSDQAIGSITYRTAPVEVQGVPPVGGQDPNGFYAVGEGTATPTVAGDASHPDAQVRWYNICASPEYIDRPIGILKVGQDAP